jgi:hypothetical protein
MKGTFYLDSENLTERANFRRSALSPIIGSRGAAASFTSQEMEDTYDCLPR